MDRHHFVTFCTEVKVDCTLYIYTCSGFGRPFYRAVLQLNFINLYLLTYLIEECFCFQREGPGPGNYEQGHQRSNTAISSSFKSRTPRFSSSHTVSTTCNDTVYNTVLKICYLHQIFFMIYAYRVSL